MRRIPKNTKGYKGLIMDNTKFIIFSPDGSEPVATVAAFKSNEGLSQIVLNGDTIHDILLLLSMICRMTMFQYDFSQDKLFSLIEQGLEALSDIPFANDSER